MALKGKFAWLVFVLQLFFIVVFAVFVKYGSNLDAADPSNNKRVSDGAADTKGSSFVRNYPLFQDVNMMIFVGIGYLYSFLWKYGYTGIGMNFLLCAISVQWGIITHHWWNLEDGKMAIDLMSLVKGEFAAASAVIALGGIFGKVSFVQMIVFAMLEVLAYSTVNHCCKEFLQISDVGESVALHLFAAIFGCSAAFVVDRKVKVDDNANERNSYMSNLLCMLGSLVLWVFWPSFNAAGDEGDSQQRSVLNTFFALIGSGLSSFATSSLLHKDNKIVMGHIQNGALAGAVGVGATSDLMIQPFGALLIGALSGCICVVGFKYFSPLLAKLGVYDPCGINSLHGLPGLFAGILGIIAALLADTNSYGYSLYKFYPARAPLANTTTLMDIQKYSPRSIDPGLDRTAHSQALYQFIYIIAAMVSACLGGLVVGSVLRMKVLDPIEDKHMYLDDIMFDESDLKIEEIKISFENTANEKCETGSKEK